MFVRVILKNDEGRKRLFEAVKDTYRPSWHNAWKRDTYFETGYCFIYPCKVVMNTDNKTYCGVSDGTYTMTVEDFIRTYISEGTIGEL